MVGARADKKRKRRKADHLLQWRQQEADARHISVEQFIDKHEKPGGGFHGLKETMTLEQQRQKLMQLQRTGVVRTAARTLQVMSRVFMCVHVCACICTDASACLGTLRRQRSLPGMVRSRYPTALTPLPSLPPALSHALTRR